MRKRQGITEGTTDPWENERDISQKTFNRLMGRGGKWHSCRQVCIFAVEDEGAPSHLIGFYSHHYTKVRSAEKFEERSRR